MTTVTQQFIFRKINISALSGNRQARSWLIVSPAVEKVRSDGVADAWTQRYLAAKLDSAGRVPLMSHHQVTGSTVDKVDGKPL